MPNNIRLLLITAVFVMLAASSTAASSIHFIPKSLQINLSKKYPGYHIPAPSAFAPVVLEIFGYTSLDFNPAVIWGDWNGDALMDAAILLIKKEKEEHIIVVACHNISKKRYNIIELDHVLRPKVLGVTKLLDFLHVATPEKQKPDDNVDMVSPSHVKWKYAAIERTVLGQESTVYYWDGTRYQQLPLAD